MVEGDSFHPSKNVEKMRSGAALDDNDRHGWLQALRAHAWQEVARLRGEEGQACGGEVEEGINHRLVVVACSALTHRYRRYLAGGTWEESGHSSSGDSEVEGKHCSSAPVHVAFLVLHGTEHELRRRMEQRSGHFMPPSLLQSQLRTLQLPQHLEVGGAGRAGGGLLRVCLQENVTVLRIDGRTTAELVVAANAWIASLQK